MAKKVATIIFIVLFFCMIAVPLAASFFQHEEVAIEQNRPLAPPPSVHVRPGHLNPSFTMDLESWVNDHIGFRKFFVDQNGKMRYYLVGRFPIDRPLILGPDGELNYASFESIRDYQHRNLYSASYLDKAAESLQTLSDYAKDHHTELYYYQCWDKHSIYPEYFPKTILQYGDQSKTDEIIQAFEEKTDVPVISPKEELIKGKERFDTYSIFGDPTHWSQRGAYLGYLKLMEGINQDQQQKYPVLTEKDYKITTTDQGLYLYGSIHKEDLLERFDLKNPKGKLTQDKITLGKEDPRTLFYTNDEVDNDSRIVLVGDSYFYFYILDDIAESFHETVFIWGDHLGDIKDIIADYHPDILVIENAEREDRTGVIIQAAEN